MTKTQELVLIRLLLDYRADYVPIEAVVNFVKLVVERTEK